MADKLVKDYALDITRKLVDMNDGTHAEVATRGQRNCLGTQAIMALSAVTPVALAVPATAVAAEIQADGGIVRCRRDAGVPSATTGWRIADGQALLVDSVLANVRLIAQSGVTTNVQIAYFDRA